MNYIALPHQEAFDIEYWQLEEAKLKRMPPEKELARSVAVVVGAGCGIGRAVAHRLAKEGAHVVCADSNGDAAGAAAKELTGIYGVGIGVAGTAIAGCGPAIAVSVDITDRASVRNMLKQAVWRTAASIRWWSPPACALLPTAQAEFPTSNRD